MVAARPDSSKLVRPADERVNWLKSIPFLLVHTLCLTAIWTGISARAAILCVVLYWTRGFFITAGYHRYFSHKGYRLNRFWQFVMAFGGTTSAQKGPLWWASPTTCWYHQKIGYFPTPASSSEFASVWADFISEEEDHPKTPPRQLCLGGFICSRSI